MAYWRDIERCRGALVHEFHRYWVSKRGARAMPDRADIDPTEIKHLLPNVIIVDIAADPFRVRYRLLGSRVVAASGMDFTGRYLDELVAADVEDCWDAAYRTVRAEGCPVFGEATVPTGEGASFTYDFGIFPLGSDGATVTQCIAIEDYGPLNERMFELADRTRPWQPKPVRTKDSDAR